MYAPLRLEAILIIAALTRLYRDLVKKTLANDIFSATEVYYDVSISLYSNGMEFYIYGFNDYSVIYELTTRLTSGK